MLPPTVVSGRKHRAVEEIYACPLEDCRARPGRSITLSGPALASGGSGGGGSPVRGVLSGGGGGGRTCTKALSLTASATEDLAGNAFIAGYTLVSCQSKTHVSMTATDMTTPVVR